MPRLQAQDALEERLRLDGRFQHREAVVEVRLGRDLGQHGLQSRPGGGIVIQLQTQRAIGGVELQAIEQDS